MLRRNSFFTIFCCEIETKIEFFFLWASTCEIYFDQFYYKLLDNDIFDDRLWIPESEFDFIFVFGDKFVGK